ncbi:MAG TPA: glycosyltransferase, partial [Bacteroidia bacterium]|nr:glycosyltransferase [Bacteroidia bacterium]
MRIGIEAQRLFRTKKHGMDIFALELIKALQTADTPHDFYIFVKPDEDDKVISEKHNFKIIKLDGSPYPLWEQWVLPSAVKKHKIDILHCTANTAPIFSPARLITTLHDIIYLEKIEINKGTLYQRVGNLYRRWNVPLAVKRSKLICTVSEYERERIIDRLNVSPEKVVTVYNGVGEHFKKITDTAKLNALREKYKLPVNYILFLGNPAPKKNVHGLLQALAILKKEKKLTLPVVIADLNRQYILQLLQDLGEEELIADI